MILAIIQARYNSTRFPGKILKRIKGKSLLEILVLRLKRSKTIDKIIVATTNEKEDLETVNLCKKMKINFCERPHKSCISVFFKSKIKPRNEKKRYIYFLNILLRGL